METAWEQKTLVGKILERQRQAESLRQPYDDRFADIVDFCQPGLTSWTSDDTEGTFRGERLYEGTPPWALRQMANGWLGNLISEALRWFKYAFADPFLRDNDQVNKHIQDREDHMYSVYRRSELYAAMSPYTRAAFSVGSPVIIPYESKKEGRIKFEVPHPKENFHLPHEAYHRKFTKTALEAVIDFMGGRIPDNVDSAEDLPLSKDLLTNFKNGQHTMRYQFVRAIYRQDDPILTGEEIRYRNRPWMEFYVQCGVADTEQKRPVLVQGHWTKPHIRWDYEINSDEHYSRTPAWHAMMDIRSGQELARQKLEAGQRALNPPMWAQKKYVLHLRPKGITRYDTIDERENMPRPIQERINYPLGDEVHQMTIQAVERWFHVELFSMLTRLAREKAGWPTATHIIHLNAEKAIPLSPLIGRFTNVIRQIDDRCQDIERRAGRGPMAPQDMPDILQEYMAYKRIQGETSIELDMDFIGPLAQIQQKSLTLGRVETGLAIQQAFLAVDPMLVHKTRNSVAYEKALEQVGFPQDAIVPETEYQEALAAIAEQEAAERQLAQQGASAEMMPKMSKSIEPGSPLGFALEAAQEGAV